MQFRLSSQLAAVFWLQVMTPQWFTMNNRWLKAALLLRYMQSLEIVYQKDKNTNVKFHEPKKGQIDMKTALELAEKASLASTQ